MNTTLDLIEKATELVAGKDYYFSPGRTYPSFLPKQKGMLSSSMVSGYKIIKGDKEVIIESSNPNQELAEVINFLDEKKQYLVDSK